MALPPGHLLDELPIAYVDAVAARAGAVIARGRDYGVDGTLRHVLINPRGEYVETGTAVDFQLKGTAVARREGGVVKYDFRVRNHNAIAARRPGQTPFYLFLVCFDGEPEAWLTVGADSLTLHASAFWWTSAGYPSLNRSTVRLEIPVLNRLTPLAISDMLERSRRMLKP